LYKLRAKAELLHVKLLWEWAECHAHEDAHTRRPQPHIGRRWAAHANIRWRAADANTGTGSAHQLVGNVFVGYASEVVMATSGGGGWVLDKGGFGASILGAAGIVCAGAGKRHGAGRFLPDILWQ
jgi:hypothetical protein